MPPLEINFFKNNTNTRTFTAGETIFNEGDKGDFAYGVQAGQVEIVYHGKALNLVGAGGVIGEMALLDDSPRSAGAVAKTDCVLVPFDRHHFLFMVQESPVFCLFVMQTMAERLRKMMDGC